MNLKSLQNATEGVKKKHRNSSTLTCRYVAASCYIDFIRLVSAVSGILVVDLRGKRCIVRAKNERNSVRAESGIARRESRLRNSVASSARQGQPGRIRLAGFARYD